MKNVIKILLVFLLCSAFSCDAELKSDQLSSMSIPSYLQNDLGLVSVTHNFTPSATFRKKMLSMAKSQFPSLYAQANWTSQIQIKFQDYQVCLAPLSEPGSYLALMQRSTKYKLLQVEWSPDLFNFFFQLHATDGKEIMYSTPNGLSDQGGEFAIMHPNPCRYCNVLPANASLSTCFLEYWYNLTQMDEYILKTDVLGVPHGIIFGLQSFACVCLQ
jgi:hypothetical protein